MTDLPDAVVEAAAEASHIAYEDAALEHGWETQERSRVPWADVPEENKATVRVAIRAALAAASGPWAEQLEKAQAELDNLRDRVTALADEIHEMSLAEWDTRSPEGIAEELRAAIVRGSDDAGEDA